MISPRVFEIFGFPCKIFSTLEGENPGGSIKDHMALGALKELLSTGTLQGKVLTEASAGSTAKSLAHYCRTMKIPCVLFVPDTLAIADQEGLRALGAEVRAVPMNKAWEIYAEYCRLPNVVAFNQHTDIGKRKFYSELGRFVSVEIGKVDVILGAVGTSHSLLGVAEGMKPKPRVISAEPLLGEVSGIRNVETTRWHGPDDPCVPELFDQRVLVDTKDFYSKNQIETSVGLVEFPDSFRVVLGAMTKLLKETNSVRSMFLLGAANRRVTK